MPAASVPKKEQRVHFVKAGGRETAASEVVTEALRGADPLVAWSRKVTDFEWLRDACEQVFDRQEVEGVQVEGIRYSNLELILGSLIRVGDDYKGWVFKDTMFAPDFLARGGTDCRAGARIGVLRGQDCGRGSSRFESSAEGEDGD